MRLSTREDIELPVADAFAAITDFAYLERQILRRGIDIARTDDMEEPDVGMAWEAALDWKARPMEAELELTEWQPTSRVVVAAVTEELMADIEAEFVALSRQATRVRVTLTLRGQSFRGRMLAQSLSLAKSKMERKLSSAVHAVARDAERRVTGM